MISKTPSIAVLIVAGSHHPRHMMLNETSEVFADSSEVERAEKSASSLETIVSDQPDRDPIEAFLRVKDPYGVLVTTRSLEIQLFWQRSIYFLVLNTALAVGFFKNADEYGLIFAALGLATALLWARVALGGKFWQTRWEQQLADFEAEYAPGLLFFSADLDRVRLDVAKGMGFSKSRGVKRLIYGALARSHPSVSLAMISLAYLFAIGWLGVGLTLLARLI